MKSNIKRIIKDIIGVIFIFISLGLIIYTVGDNIELDLFLKIFGKSLGIILLFFIGLNFLNT